VGGPGASPGTGFAPRSAGSQTLSWPLSCPHNGTPYARSSTTEAEPCAKSFVEVDQCSGPLAARADRGRVESG
jgi:hypothetical protein